MVDDTVRILNSLPEHLFPDKSETETLQYSNRNGYIFTLAVPESKNPLRRAFLEPDTRQFNSDYYTHELHTLHAVKPAEKDERFGRLPVSDNTLVRPKYGKEYRLPSDWKHAWALLQEIILIEHSNNPHWRDYNTYLSVSHDPETLTPRPAPNVGKGRVLPSRNYAVWGNSEMGYYAQTFKESGTAGRGLVFAPEGQVYFFDGYFVPVNLRVKDAALPATFLKLSWESETRAGGTLNRMFPH